MFPTVPLGFQSRESYMLLATVFSCELVSLKSIRPPIYPSCAVTGFPDLQDLNVALSSTHGS